MRRALQIECEGCGAPICFSTLDSLHFSGEELVCLECDSKYHFDEELMVQLRQFEALCLQIRASEKILGSSAVAVDIGTHHVKVPFNILLTRLSSVIDLEINGKKQTFSFRIEPGKDIRPLAGCSSVQ